MRSLSLEMGAARIDWKDPLTYNEAMTNTRSVRVGAGLILAALALMAAWILAHVALEWYVDALWFRAVGFATVFWTLLRTRVALGGIAALLTFGVLYLNLRLARRASMNTRPLRFEEFALDAPTVDRLSRGILVLGAAFVAALVGLSMSRDWRAFLQFRYAVPFGMADPVFGHDAGFYVFRLPILASVCQVLMTLTVLCMVFASPVYWLRGALDLSGTTRVLTNRAFSHFSALGGVLALLYAAHCWLARYELLFSKRGAVYGAGYTDIHAQVGANALLAVLALIAGVWLLVNAGWRKRPGNAYVLGAYAVAAALAGSAYPALVQTVLVKPNEYAREEPYLRNNIAFTRYAYGLDAVEQRSWPGNGVLGPAQLAAHPGTADNLLLWDTAPLLDLYNQQQRIRLYYNFGNVDMDRYVIDGRLRPVMVAPRELNPLQLPEKSLVWTNLYMQYTHGYGLCMTLANRVAPGGQPESLVSNVPPESRPGLEVTEPRIYYGEQTALYALTGTRLDEFDYPGEPENAFNRYAGPGGIPVSSLFRRLLFAWFTGDKDILFTNQFTESSRILLFRQVRERVMKIAPFLYFDEDPYPVLCSGRIVWVLDGYTLTDRFPYSEAIGVANYWRNSVKVTIDACDGTVTFYRFDAEDPLLRVLDRAFPGLFQPREAVPEALRAHLRYPMDLFRVQTQVYRRYHMDDPQQFFTNEDMWTFPKTGTDANASFEPPRYLVLELPDVAGSEQFVLARTFTVEGKDNMIAWMAAGCDGANYGKLTAYCLPKSYTVYGPTQIKGRFNQNPDISAFMTLMGQMGSSIIQSKVLAVPIEQGLLYIQSMYIEDPQVKIPELKQIIVGQGDRVAMAPSLAEALGKLFGSPSPEGDTPEGAPLTPPAGDRERAAQNYRDARERLKAGDWAGFGAAFDALGRALEATGR